MSSEDEKKPGRVHAREPPGHSAPGEHTVQLSALPNAHLRDKGFDTFVHMPETGSVKIPESEHFVV